MSDILQELCRDVRALLRERDDHEGREQVRRRLEVALRDPAFCAEHLGTDQPPGVHQLHADAELGFCVLTYRMTAPRSAPPHDHGDSWAVYGQAEGHTDMTVWTAADGVARPVRSFRLEPGQAGLFDVGDIHSIRFSEGARFVRVTGADLSGQPQRVYEPEGQGTSPT